MKNKILLLSLISCFLFSCQPLDEDWHTPGFLIVQFKEGMEHYSEYAWVHKQGYSYPYYGRDWLQPLYPLGNGYYISLYSDFDPDIGSNMRYDSTYFLSTTREEWNAGNQEISYSLMLCEIYDVLNDNHIWIARSNDELVFPHLTIERDSLKHRYISWADTAWFRLNVLNQPIDEGHFIHFN